ncbi:MAG TPA: hypothetical protein PKX28_01040 [Candidatus Hydrogenedentes bacterium]|nr:hypothetical protein [Candidatus Hydrogenedentota bacterium]HOK89010.1 hypothetical protein [Candidatus Hydrogenedentota bacterium]HPO29797.1 hypothetical protein [Candidatus Hydrogenedentota bacterium]
MNLIRTRISDYFRARRLTRLADGVLQPDALTPEEAAYIAEHQRLRALLQQACAGETFPGPPGEEAFVRAWRQRSQHPVISPGKPAWTSRHTWTVASLAAAALLVLFALLYLFAPVGEPVTAGPKPVSHPEMERSSSQADTLPGDNGTQTGTLPPDRDL